MRTTKRAPTKMSIDAARALLRDSLPRLREEFGVTELGVFGSYVTGKQRGDSDIDVLVEFDESRRLTMFEFVRLERQLSEMLGLKVDLVMKSALKPGIGKRILAQVVPV